MKKYITIMLITKNDSDSIKYITAAIPMGCDVGCPYIGREFDDNWGLPDPTGESDEVFMEVIKSIEKNVLELKS